MLPLRPRYVCLYGLGAEVVVINLQGLLQMLIAPPSRGGTSLATSTVEDDSGASDTTSNSGA